MIRLGATPAQAGRGVFVAIVGASGAGKDTVIREARSDLRDDPAILFVRRMVTRPSGPDEDHATVSEEAFTAGLADGSFACSWRAHGLGYAVPHAVRSVVAQGTVAVCNLSRTALPDARLAFGRIFVVQIAASPDRVAERLLSRGREDAPAIADRLRRETAMAPVDADLTIINDGTPEEAGRKLCAALKGLQTGVSAVAQAVARQG